MLNFKRLIRSTHKRTSNVALHIYRQEHNLSIKYMCMCVNFGIHVFINGS